MSRGTLSATGANVLSLRLAYMTGQYPRVTDTFIQREVAALRELGHYVQTFSVRSPQSRRPPELNCRESQRTTIYLLPPRGLRRRACRAISIFAAQIYFGTNICVQDFALLELGDFTARSLFCRGSHSSAAYVKALAFSSSQSFCRLQLLCRRHRRGDGGFHV